MRKIKFPYIGLWGSEGITQFVFNVGSRQTDVVSFKPEPQNQFNIGWDVPAAGLHVRE
jgi:hypothetical protein